MVLIGAALLLLSCSKDPFPAGRETANAIAGDLIVKTGTYLDYNADYCTLVAPENRRNADSRLIELPVIRVRSANTRPGAPVFVLGGGPGAPNVLGEEALSKSGAANEVIGWLLESHDVVFVGYRGVDGGVTLRAPEFRALLSRIERPLSQPAMQALGRALGRDLRNAAQRGVDLSGYNVVEVSHDIEAVRAKLGYEAIDLLSVSYGGQVAYTYCLEHAQRVHRNVMLCTDAPGHLAVWDCATLDEQLQHYAELWGRDQDRAKRCDDLRATMRAVLDSLDRAGEPDPDRVRIMTVATLYSTGAAPYVFDAYIDAYNGDFGKLSLLAAAFTYAMPRSVMWGDFFLKLYSMGGFDPEQDYGDEFTDSLKCVLGSPMAQLFFGPARYMEVRIPVTAKEYREGRYCDVSTLFVSGNLDVSGPAANVRKYLLPYFRNGHLVEISEFGHADVLAGERPGAFRRLVTGYLDDGTVDDSQYEYTPVEFERTRSFEVWLRDLR